MRLFERDRRSRAKRKALENVAGSLRGLRCLEVGGIEGGLSFFLRRVGGLWSSVDLTEDGAASLRQILRQDDIYVMDNGRLPVADGSFDLVVLVDCLEVGEGDHTLVSECHRVLKAQGRLIVLAPHEKTRGLLNPLRRFLGARRHLDGHEPRSFSEPELFSSLKDGFDVHEVRDFTRFFSAAVDVVTAWRVDRIRRSAGWTAVPIADWDSPEAQKIEAVYKWMSPLSALASILDALLFFTKGYHLIAVAQRRIWRPRKTPILRDGRSIADATLNTKIGSAAPF